MKINLPWGSRLVTNRWHAVELYVYRWRAMATGTHCHTCYARRSKPEDELEETRWRQIVRIIERMHRYISTS